MRRFRLPIDKSRFGEVVLRSYIVQQARSNTNLVAYESVSMIKNTLLSTDAEIEARAARVARELYDQVVIEDIQSHMPVESITENAEPVPAEPKPLEEKHTSAGDEYF